MPLIESGVLGEFPYAILEHDVMGHLCGYLGVPRNHPWYGLDYDDIYADVHGGITFSRDSDEADYPMELPPSVHAWWVGFDCAHYGDLVPNMPFSPLEGEVYRDRNFVFHELEDLARQASEVVQTPV